MELTVIIPVHKYTEKVRAYLTNAIASVKSLENSDDVKLMIVSPKSVDFGDDINYENVEFVNSKKSDFCSQVNEGVKNCKTKYFSILELDDIFTEKWLINVEKEIEKGESASLYLPLTELYDDVEKKHVGYINEVVWANSFSDELGFLDMESLSVYMNFNVTGGVFETEEFKNIGGLKPSIKLSFWYEFLLRMINNGNRVYVIPKTGYIHTINREDSLTSTYQKTMTQDEADFYMDLAKKDYFFKKERDKSHYIFEENETK